MKKMLSAMIVVVFLSAACLLAETAKVTGKWQMSLDTPHGPMTAGLNMKQEGATLSGTCVSDHLGTVAIKGTVESEKISFAIEMAEGQKVSFTGTVTGNKIAGTSDFGSWSATRQ